MRIEEIRIENFKGISELVIKPNKINVFLGRNNSGKTSILEAIELGIEPSIRIKEEKSEGEFIQYMIHKEEKEAKITVRTSDNLFETTITHPEEEEIISKFKEETVATVVRAVKRITEKEVSAENITVISEQIEKLINKDVRSRIIKNAITIKTNNENNNLQEIHRGYHNEIAEIIRNEKLLAVLRKKFHFRGTEKWIFSTIFAIRPTSFEQKQKRKVIFLKDLLERTPTVEKEKQYPEKISRVEKKIKELELLPNLERLSMRFTVFHGKTEYKVPFEFLGDGFKAIVTLLWHTSEKEDDPTVILLDEPETHMHPGYIRELIRYLIEKAKNDRNQIFITTHSIDVMDEIINMEEYKEFLKEYITIFKADKVEDIVLIKSSNFEEAARLRNSLASDLRGA